MKKVLIAALAVAVLEVATDHHVHIRVERNFVVELECQFLIANVAELVTAFELRLVIVEADLELRLVLVIVEASK